MPSHFPRFSSPSGNPVYPLGIFLIEQQLSCPHLFIGSDIYGCIQEWYGKTCSSDQYRLHSGASSYSMWYSIYLLLIEALNLYAEGVHNNVT